MSIGGKKKAPSPLHLTREAPMEGRASTDAMSKEMSCKFLFANARSFQSLSITDHCFLTHRSMKSLPLLPLLTFAFTASAILSTASFATNWPQFRGPNQDGSSPETGLPEKF